jgi:hypothetical protein
MIVLETSTRRVTPLMRTQTVGAGESARLVASLLSKVVEHQGARAANWRPLVRVQIEEIAHECATRGWDGYGAVPVTQRTRENAERFVDLLPSDIPPPAVVPAPNGHIALTWDFGPGRILTISVGESGSAAYAGILGNGVRRHGVELFRDDVAKVLIESIREVSAAV